MKAFMVEALRNYTHKSFIAFLTIGLIFLICMMIEFGRLVWITSTSSKPDVIIVYSLGFVFSVGIFSLTFFLLFLFWEVVQHAIDRTTWGYNCVRVLFLLVDVITAVKWYSAAIQGRPDGINFILMATYIKVGSLALLGFLFLTLCVYSQRKNQTFQSLLTLKFGVVIFLSIHSITIMTFRYRGISWQITGIACFLYYILFAYCVMVRLRSSKEESGLTMQIKMTSLLVVLYVIIISLFLVVHYDMNCDNHCGQHSLPSTHKSIKHSLDALDTPKVLDVDFSEVKEKLTCKIKKDSSFSYFTETKTTHNT